MADFIRFAGSVPRKENEIMVEYIELNDALAALRRAYNACDIEASFAHALTLANKEMLELEPIRWIPVGEALPKEGERVLCCTRNKKGAANIVLGYYMDGLWRVGMNSNVTHWMPLPEPPEGLIGIVRTTKGE